MSMLRYPRHRDIDLRPFKKDTADSTRYGLPLQVRFCRHCVISNQRPNSAVEYEHTKDSRKNTINFDDEGVCDACRLSEQKHGSIDWTERALRLHELCDRHRSRDGSYDCIVPGSGGKDSFYAAHLLKYKYGMHPLTFTWAPHVYTEWGWRNFQSWIHAGFDNFLCTPNGRVHRLLTRLAVENLFHPFQAFIFGQKSLAPKMALLHRIPLVFYGENEAEYGNPILDTQSARRDWSYFAAADRSKAYLGGTSVADLRAQFGFEASPERTPGTYSKYNSIDDRIDDFHYYTTYIKFGIGRATYDAAQEIRSGDITREEGVALVKRFDGEYPERFAEEVFRYLNIPRTEFPTAAETFEQPVVTHESFLELADKFRSPHLWRRDDDG